MDVREGRERGRERTDAVVVDVAEHVATVTLDRPPLNAVTFETLAMLRDVMRTVGEDRDVRAVILTAAGERAFVAGIDLNELDAPHPDAPAASAVTDPQRVAREAMWAIRDCAVPVIGAINGPAVGAGLALAACCDVLVAAEHATFATPEINVGLLGASAHLHLVVGRHRARELFLTGESITAAELHRLGAVRAVVPSAQLAATARELALGIAARSPIAVRLAKESLNRTEFLPLEEAYRVEQDYTDRLRRFADADEARAAYVERRPPVWGWP